LMRQREVEPQGKGVELIPGVIEQPEARVPGLGDERAPSSGQRSPLTGS
jgi:hypothetical protein